ncbi:MAG TPA: DNA replication/repair protein RecF [Porticoccaceae bacterium]|nr:DNA replication/repair protein RecF [Porticoccaceae bacterium]
MRIKKLAVKNVRNIDSIEIEPAPGLNFIFGENGSGKTSLLEAIYLLSRGRSFRTRRLQSIISADSKDCTVFAKLLEEESTAPREIPLGVSRRAGGGFVFKIDGRSVQSAAKLSETLPLILLNSESFALVEAGPAYRRKFLDWGVFHVEPAFQMLWRDFRRCLKQRNSLLRHDKMSRSQLLVWDQEFVRVSEQMSALRRDYFEQLRPIFSQLLEPLSAVEGLELTFKPGWEESKPLEEALKDSFNRDRRQGQTHVGAHRSDIEIIANGRPALETLSRGQIKVVLLALQIAQGQTLKNISQRSCLYLLDDLAAELDQEHLQRGLYLLADMGIQAFVTGTNSTQLESAVPKDGVNMAALFHVKQGALVA